MKVKDYVWPVVGLAAVGFSAWLLYHELRGLSLNEVMDSFTRISLHRWLLAVRPETDLSRQGFNQLLAAVQRGQDTRFSLGAKGFAVVRRGVLLLQRR